jgi:hypothetical protein
MQNVIFYCVLEINFLVTDIAFSFSTFLFVVHLDGSCLIKIMLSFCSICCFYESTKFYAFPSLPYYFKISYFEIVINKR